MELLLIFIVGAEELIVFFSLDGRGMALDHQTGPFLEAVPLLSKAPVCFKQLAHLAVQDRDVLCHDEPRTAASPFTQPTPLDLNVQCSDSRETRSKLVRTKNPNLHDWHPKQLESCIVERNPN